MPLPRECPGCVQERPGVCRYGDIGKATSPEGGGTLREAPPPFRSAFYGQHAAAQPLAFIAVAQRALSVVLAQPIEAACMHLGPQVVDALQQLAHACPAYAGQAC